MRINNEKELSLKAQQQIRSDTETEFHSFITGHHEHGAIAKVSWKKIWQQLGHYAVVLHKSLFLSNNFVKVLPSLGFQNLTKMYSAFF